MIEVNFTGFANCPLEVTDVYGNKIHLHHFLLEDDDDWEDFISQLNFYRENYLNGKLEQLQKNIQKSQKNA